MIHNLQLQRNPTLSKEIRLDITIIIFASPDIAALALEDVSDHIVDEPMLIPQLLGLEVLLVVLVVEFLEDIFEPSIVFLEDGVLRGEVERIVPVQGELETAVGEGMDRIIMVEHHHGDTRCGEVVHRGCEALVTLEVGLEVALAWDEEVHTVVLITEGVPSNDNRLLPSSDESRNILDNDGFPEDGSVEVVSDSSVGGFPHFFEVKLLDSCLIWSDGSALDADLAFLDGLRGLQSDLVVGFVSVFNAQIEVLDVEVEEGMDEFILDLLPDDPSHLVTIKLSNRV